MSEVPDWVKNAKVGDKVVCVNNDTDIGFVFDATGKPMIGRVYTILAAWVDDDGDVVFEFVELRRSWKACAEHGKKLGYAAWRFRPVQPRKTDISVFKRLLNTTPADLVEA